MNVFVEGISPLPNIIIIPLIVDHLAINKNYIGSIKYLAILCIVNLLIKLGNNIFEQCKNMDDDKFRDKMKLQIGDISMQTEFKNIESGKFSLDYEIAYKSMFWWSGYIKSLNSNLIGLFSNIISIISIIMIVMIMKQYFALFIIGIILCSIILEFKKSKHELEMFQKSVKFNRDFRYYTSIIKEYKFAKEIKLFQANELINSKVEEYNTNSINLFSNNAKKRTQIGLISTFIYVIFQTSMYINLAVQVIRRVLTIGNFMAVITAYNNLYDKSIQIFNLFFGIRKSIDLISNYYSFIDLYSNQNPKGTPDHNCEKESIELVFDNVWFSYRNDDDYALKNINIKICSNQKLSIVGVNGSGKTTFIKLLVGLYKPTKGIITINGVDIHDLPKEFYYNLVTAVFQDFKIFEDSVYSNVIMNQNNNEEYFWNVIKKVKLDEEVNRLPKGKDTIIYKNFNLDGVELSGGQMQRIAIARAIYKNTNCIILDEPTAALDPQMEDEIYKLVSENVSNKTIILISHRLSSCRICDKIAVFNDGIIVEYGNHETLINYNGLYAKLFSIQAKYYASEIGE
jgi:ATP-binding cassette subfamily B protein/ATP-binding cassette subfamily C protein